MNQCIDRMPQSSFGVLQRHPWSLRLNTERLNLGEKEAIPNVHMWYSKFIGSVCIVQWLLFHSSTFGVIYGTMIIGAFPQKQVGTKRSL